MSIERISDINPNFYFEVAGKKTFSKTESLLLANGDSSKIIFNCHDNAWSNIDISKEPEEDIQSLCIKRCHILADQYDWLCLWLSSGYDSQTALSSFIQSRILLNEIAFMDRSEYYDDPELPIIEETIKNYKHLYNPNLVVTRIKIGFDYHLEFYKKTLSDWALGPSSSLRFSKTIPAYIHNYNNQLFRSKDKSRGRRADIYGKEKPRLNLKDNLWYMFSTDKAYDDITGSGGVGFFISDQLPELFLKQVHLAIKYYETIPNITHELVHRIQNNTDSFHYKQLNLAMGRVPIALDPYVALSLKNNFTSNENSKDSLKLRNHLATIDKRLLELIDNNRKDIENQLNGLSLDTTIMGREWKIRPFFQKNKD